MNWMWFGTILMHFTVVISQALSRWMRSSCSKRRYFITSCDFLGWYSKKVEDAVGWLCFPITSITSCQNKHFLWDKPTDIQRVATTYCESHSMLICAWKAINNSSDVKVRGYSHKSKPVGRKFCLFLQEWWFRLLQQGISKSAKQNRDGLKLHNLSWWEHTRTFTLLNCFQTNVGSKTVYYGSTEMFHLLPAHLCYYSVSVDSQWFDSFSSQLATFRHLLSPLMSHQTPVAPRAHALSHSFSIFGGQTHTHKVCYWG